MQNHDHANSTLPDFVAWVNFSTDDAPISYAFQTEARTWLVVHIATMSIATFVLLPAALLLRKSRWRLFISLACCTSVLVGCLSAFVHNKRTPNLYENALHRKFGIVLIAAICAHAIHLLTQAVRDTRRSSSIGGSRARFIPLDQEEACDVEDAAQDTRTSRLQEEEEEDDSARSSETMYRQQSGSLDRQDSFDDLALHAGEVSQKHTETDRTKMAKVGQVLSSVWPVLVLFLAYVQILLGIATYCGLFTNHEIFNGLAHWIKASIFLLFGIWVFIRYLGGLASIGHAWNDVTGKHVSPETIECSLIFIYGSSNLFLERLGHSDEPISHTDIQHMSIAAMFACAGLIGLLIESRAIQDLLMLECKLVSSGTGHSRRTTYNVMPALVVFFTGVLMSQHSQDTQFASDVHAGWGYYFCTASAFRLITYILIFSSSWSRRPRRPPTEALVAFCLIAGALVFMMSARDPVQSLEYYGIDFMFTISLSVAGALAILVWVLYTQILIGIDHRHSMRSRPR